ncbi:MAG: pyridoxamine 5'-phosphate oxidase family protein [Erysipelotrichaceae bacterium]|nr:pyridoxamine 5'-phosphate oxidase family protein [Erysipelotrichaceae bacterium]
MRRADREVTDLNIIYEVIRRCDVLRLGLYDGEYPYIVPVNFGYRFDEDIILYFHGAKAGKKYELIKKNNKCSFEMDNELMIDLLYDSKSVTTRYESVMGKGIIRELDNEDKIMALNYLMSSYEKTKDFECGLSESVLDNTAVYELKVSSISCKINPVK